MRRTNKRRTNKRRGGVLSESNVQALQNQMRSFDNYFGELQKVNGELNRTMMATNYEEMKKNPHLLANKTNAQLGFYFVNVPKAKNILLKGQAFKVINLK